MKKNLFFILLCVIGLQDLYAVGIYPILVIETDTTGYVPPMDTTVYNPSVDTTYYEPVDTGEVVTPIQPSKPVIHVPVIREDDNVTEYPHNPVVDEILSSVKPTQQEFTMTIEGDYLRIKGTLFARGYDKHYIHCQILGDSVHLQRFDMDPESTDMILHNVDIRIPGFTADYYHVTLAEQNDVPLYKQYMVMSRSVKREATQKTTEFSITGTKWYVNSHNSNHYHGTYSNTLVSYGIDKDTIIGGNVWKRLCKDSEELGYLREMDEQVWFYPTNLEGQYPCKNGHPFMLYDFSLQKGDTVYWNYWQMGYTRVPTQEDHIYNETMIVKDVRFEHGRKIIDFGYGSKWIEGVGETGFAFFDLWFPRPTNGSSSSETVFQVTSGGQTIYFNGEVLDPDAALWLKTGMTWTQNWDYIETSNGKYRQITLDKEIRPGTFTFNSTCIDHWFPLKHIQEFNGKVYTIDGDQNIDLCYDFTLQEGNSVSILSAYWWEDPLTPAPPVRKYNKSVVSVVDSVEYSGIMRKRIVLEGEYNDVWVEGIGSLTRVLPIDDYNFPTGIVFDSSRITCMNDNGKLLYLHPDFIDCTTPRIDNITSLIQVCAQVHPIGQTLLCTSPTAVKLEVYTMDAIKVGEAAFTSGEASVKVGKAPATYLYIVTYPDGRRESGKVMITE